MTTIIRQINSDPDDRKSKSGVFRNLRIRGMEKYPMMMEMTSPTLIKPNIRFPCRMLKSLPAIPQKLTRVIYTMTLTQVYRIKANHLVSKAQTPALIVMTVIKTKRNFRLT